MQHHSFNGHDGSVDESIDMNYRRVPDTALLIKTTINVNTAEPIIAQIIGKVFPPILISKSSGKPSLPASHIPI